MSDLVAVPVSTFHGLFAGPAGIRVRIDWNETLRRDLPVSVRFVSTFDAFERCYFPWYVPDHGDEAGFDDEARPVAVSDLPEIEPRLREDRRWKIARLRAALRESGGVQLLVPAYDLGDDRLLLLDACHRIAALADAPVPLAAAILILHGPLDPRILPDLDHWDDA